MSLSNYLLQSVVMSILFYGYGLGWYARVSPIVGFILAIAIYAAQVLVSNLWFRRFAFGPAEWLWRCLTYGQWFRLKLPAGSADAVPELAPQGGGLK